MMNVYLRKVKSGLWISMNLTHYLLNKANISSLWWNNAVIFSMLKMPVMSIHSNREGFSSVNNFLVTFFVFLQAINNHQHSCVLHPKYKVLVSNVETNWTELSNFSLQIYLPCFASATDKQSELKIFHFVLVGILKMCRRMIGENAELTYSVLLPSILQLMKYVTLAST